MNDQQYFQQKWPARKKLYICSKPVSKSCFSPICMKLHLMQKFLNVLEREGRLFFMRKFNQYVDEVNDLQIEELIKDSSFDNALNFFEFPTWSCLKSIYIYI